MNSNVNANLASSENSSAIRAFLFKSESARKQDNTTLTPLLSGKFLVIWRGGVGTSDQLARGDSKTSEIIFSSSQLSKNHSVRIQSIAVSPDKATVAMVSVKHGALGEFWIDVLDLQMKKRIGERIHARSPNVSWASNDKFYFDPIDKVWGTAHAVFDRLKPNNIDIEDGWWAGSGGLTAIFENNEWIISDREGHSRKIFGEFGKVLGEDTNFFYMQTQGVYGLGEIRRIAKSELLPAAEAKSARKIVSDPFVREKELSVITSATFADKKFFVMRRWGSATSIQILKLDGTEIATIPVPSSLRAISIQSGSTENVYKVSLSSAVSASKEFTYDIETKKWDRESFEEELLTVDGIPMTSEIVEYESQGGKIPMRIVRRKDLPADGARPVLMEVYGGFNTTGGIDGNRTPMKNEFVKRGGILAFPAIRGGNEFGRQWYQAAVKQNKKNSMLDLIAGAKWLASSGWSKPEKIAITGASNGGFVTASAGLMAPEAFGLVIPNSGVLDLGGFTETDPRAITTWVNDYGDPRDPKARENIDQISPVELAKRLEPGAKVPKFLVVVGLKDDRVNPIHSERFAKALREKVPAQINLIGLKNAGHNVSSMAYSDLIGLRTSSAMWIYIYDTLGMKF